MDPTYFSKNECGRTRQWMDNYEFFLVSLLTLFYGFDNEMGVVQIRLIHDR